MTKRPPLVNLTTHPYPWVSPPELAAYLQCDRRTIGRMIEQGSLHAYRVGRTWRIPIAEARRAFPVERTSRSIS
jgi:excisionase family DNA binding protein